MNITMTKGAITIPHGFSASACASGIKKHGALDLAVIFSEQPAHAAAVFTRNRVKAWPVRVGMKHVAHSSIQAVIVNSGNANCFNGSHNRHKVLTYCRGVAHSLQIPVQSVFPSSTGMIGRDFPVTKIMRTIPGLVKNLSRKQGHRVAQAILTTDTKTKEATVTFTVQRKKVHLSAMAKGAGMLNPSMATMLVFLTTDLNIRTPLLRNALRSAVKSSFNAINVDNDMSTNDTVLMLANGAAGNRGITTQDRSYKTFYTALELITKKIARALVSDGEGVTKVCDIFITGARSVREAHCAARALAQSMLFKTALHGADPNWGRIVATVGAQHNVHCNFDRLSIAFGKYVVVKNGKPYNQNMQKAHTVLRKKEVSVYINLGIGSACAHFVTSDLTRQYISINAHYMT